MLAVSHEYSREILARTVAVVTQLLLVLMVLQQAILSFAVQDAILLPIQRKQEQIKNLRSLKPNVQDLPQAIPVLTIIEH